MLRASVPALLLIAALPAQLSLDKTGGGIGANVTFRLQGTASQPYVLLFALNEQSTPMPQFGVTLDIPDDFAGTCVGLPGFFSTLNGTGVAQPSLAIPNLPELAGLSVPFQAIGDLTATSVVSNLVRVTPQMPGTFAAALNNPLIPILSGGIVNAANGELLFVGGSGPVAQRYASRTEEWTNAGVTFGVGLLSQTTGLADGRVLFTGGLDLTTGQPTAAAAIYDPVAGTTTTLTMNVARAGHGASLMGNGRVLITGGMRAFDLTNPLSLFNGIEGSTEIFDPATGTFAAGPTLLEPRALHTSSTLSNGQVLIAGGLTLLPIVNIPTVSQTAYRFNPTSNSFGLPALFTGARFLHSAVGTSNGRVLLVGGLTLDLSVFLQTGNIQDLIIGTRSDCQLYTPSLLGFGTFATVNGMQEGRAGAAVAALPNGGALIAGGFRLTIDIPNSTFEATATASADKFTQGPNAIAPTGSMANVRLFPLATPLPDGTVMVVGGGVGGVEIWQNN